MKVVHWAVSVSHVKRLGVGNRLNQIVFSAFGDFGRVFQLRQQRRDRG